MRIFKKELLTVSLSGILLWFSFPYFPFGIFSFIALIPILLLLEKEAAGFKYGLKIGYWFGLIYNALVIYWLANNILLTAIFVVFVNALHYGLIFGVYSWCKKQNKIIALVMFPFWWTFFEYLRELGDIKFNWLSLSHTLTYYTRFIQFIEYTGTLSLTFLIVTFNILLFLIYISTKKQQKIIISGILVFLIVSLS
ncbi:MAG: hypothetical protein KAR38_12385, partial [Calditrichia bacterium]|nr:hypothetical protein [Calditrichia bacterium]